MSATRAPAEGSAAPVLWRARRLSRRSRPGDVLRALSRARHARALYGPDHPVVAESLGDLAQVIGHLLGERPAIRLFVREDTFFVENTILLDESLQFSTLLAELAERGIGTIEIRQGVENWELSVLVAVLTVKPAELQGMGGAAAHLEEHRVQHITVGASRALAAADQVEAQVDPRDAYRAGLHVVDELYFQASRDLPLDLRKARLVVNSFVDVLTRDRAALVGLTALKNYDEDTSRHSVNVGILSLLLALPLRLDRVVMTALGLGALLHDIGKVRIPREILAKPATLTAAEQETMRRHPLYGAHLLRSLPGLARLATVVAFEHHANYDRSGYPRIAGRPAPHLLTRIVQLVDFFDAATSSRRVYRQPMLPHEAVRFAHEQAGRMFDPALVRLFTRLVGLYPVGSLAELDNGDLAVVLRPPEHDPGRPVVRVVRTADGRPAGPRTIDLQADGARRIIRARDPAEAGVDPRAYALDYAAGPPADGVSAAAS